MMYFYSKDELISENSVIRNTVGYNSMKIIEYYNKNKKLLDAQEKALDALAESMNETLDKTGEINCLWSGNQYLRDAYSR